MNGIIKLTKTASFITVMCCMLSDELPSELHGPSMFAVKAKIDGSLYNQSSSIAFDETSSYWSAPKKLLISRGWSGGAMVLGKLPVPGRPTIWIIVGQGPTALAVGVGGGCLDIFSLVYHFSFLTPSLWETARYRLKHYLKGPLSQNQPTNQPNFSAFHWPPHGSLVCIGQHFVTTRVVHLPKRTETSLLTESDRSGPHHPIGPGCASRA